MQPLTETFPLPGTPTPMQHTLRHTLSPLVVTLGLAIPLLSQPLHAQGLRLTDAPATATRNAPQPREGGLATAARNAAAASQRNTQQADFIVALVNSEPITQHEVQTRKQRALAFLQAQGYSIPDDSVLQREAIDTLIAERLQLQEARDTGTTIDDFTLDQAEQNVAQQNGASIADMYKELAAEGIDRDSFRTQLRNQLVLMRIRERAVDARVRVSDQELDQHLRDNPLPGGSNVPDRLNLGHILVTVPENPSASEEAHLREKITEAARRLERGEDFAAVAAQYSEATEASKGGELGMRAIDQYPELFVQSVAGRDVGALVGPVRSGAGFHLLKVLEREQGQKDVIAQNHARHILISPSSGMDERAATQRLQEIRKRVVQGSEDFAMLAREYSQDKGSAPDGGDLGWSSPGQFVPEFEEVLATLKPGEVSAPIVSRFGMHLIQLLERRHIPMTQQHRREMVREQVREKKAEKAFGDWITQLRSRAYIEIRDGQS